MFLPVYAWHSYYYCSRGTVCHWEIKTGKKVEVVSDHIINACDHLNVHIAILFTMMLRHGLSPDGMLHDTIVPISTGRQANVSPSDNVRAITLNSSLWKLIDVIVMTKEKDNWYTCNLQFSFKLGLYCTKVRLKS